MNWREYTVDSIPEIEGAMEELDNFILEADLAEKDSRSILYMLANAAVREATIRSIYNAQVAILEQMEDHPETIKIALEQAISEKSIEDRCNEETALWREEVEDAQIQLELNGSLKMDPRYIRYLS